MWAHRIVRIQHAQGERAEDRRDGDRGQAILCDRDGVAAYGRKCRATVPSDLKGIAEAPQVIIGNVDVDEVREIDRYAGARPERGAMVAGETVSATRVEKATGAHAPEGIDATADEQDVVADDAGTPALDDDAGGVVAGSQGVAADQKMLCERVPLRGTEVVQADTSAGVVVVGEEEAVAPYLDAIDVSVRGIGVFTVRVHIAVDGDVGVGDRGRVWIRDIDPIESGRPSHCVTNRDASERVVRRDTD